MKSQGVNLNKAIEELKSNFHFVDNFITEENVNIHFEYVFEPMKIESLLTNFITYDL